MIPHLDLDALEKRPQPYTCEDLQALYHDYMVTKSAQISNDPLYFLTEMGWKYLESPRIVPDLEFDPDLFRAFMIDFLKRDKYQGLLQTSPRVTPFFELAAHRMYVLPLEDMPLHLNDPIYWEIAVWRLRINK